MFLEFPKDWRRQGKLLQQPKEQDIPDSAVEIIVSARPPTADRIAINVYEYLHNAGYWMTPGLRFGCDYTAYPGDPLRYHSHFMVHVEKEEDEGVDMLTLVGGGRVATQTRKAWMLAGEVEGKVRVFTIEWAGFG